MADDDKTEDPTPKKQEEAREKGQLGKSQDLTAAMMSAIAITFLFMYGHKIVNYHVDAIIYIFSHFHQMDLTPNNVFAYASEAVYASIMMMLPFFIVMVVAGVVANITQIGFLWTFKPMTPDFNKINPIKGLQNKFKLKTVMTAFMNIAKVVVFSMVGYLVLNSEWKRIFKMTGQDAAYSMKLFSEIFFKLAMYIIIVMLILAILDFAYQKWQSFQQNKMTKQEVRDEHKNYEGDPKIKQRRRQIQQQMARQRMMKDVKDADVVITNPTHYSIAIKYDELTMRAPTLVAKGVDVLALKIREIAKTNSIPIVENKLLARALYKSTEVGEPIPQKMFKAVAEILAYVFSLKQGAQGNRASARA
jgi:flagellar biosynthetic protein FlhB